MAQNISGHSGLHCNDSVPRNLPDDFYKLCESWREEKIPPRIVRLAEQLAEELAKARCGNI